MVRLLEVEPLMCPLSARGVAPFRHCNVTGAVPLAVAWKMTVFPAKIVWLCGCVTKLGTAAAVRTAGGELVTAFAGLDTTTTYGPALEGWKFESFKLELVAPARLASLNRHW